VELAKKASSMPIIGSINGSMPGEWVRFARLIQEAGADALELNIYFVPTDPEYNSSQVEQQYVELVSAVRKEITIPLAVKIGPFFSSLPNMARRIVAAGADGLVLFNRYLQPDIDLDTYEVVPQLVLSSREESRLPLRWIGILRHQTAASLAATSGIQTADDVLKAVLVGADVVMIASALIRRGPSLLVDILDELSAWLRHKGVRSLSEIRGIASYQRCANPAAFERANYAKALASFSPDRDGPG
jgi:dihydroorotate dehydrogenase (fumarate)